MAKVKNEGVKYERGLSPALAALAKHMGNKPLFMPPIRRNIPMQHDALGRLLGGDVTPGLPTGVFIEVLGAAGEGKSTFAMACADAVINQHPDTIHRISTDDGIEEIKAPRRVLYNDFEHVLDYAYLKSAVRNSEIAQVNDKGKLLNAKTANIYVHQPDTVEEGGDVMLHMIASGEFGLVVVDSIAAMLGDEEKKKSMGESTMGLQARAIGKFLRKSAHMVRKYGVTVILVNQWREKIGVSFGDPRVAPGGKAPEYWDAIRLNISGGKRPSPWFANGKHCTIKSMKNKVTGLQGVIAEYEIGWGTGLSAEVELTELAIGAGLIEWRGGLGRPMKIIPMKGRVFANVPEWLATLRANDRLFSQLKTLCDRAQATRPKKGNGGLLGEDDDAE